MTLTAATLTAAAAYLLLTAAFVALPLVGAPFLTS